MRNLFNSPEPSLTNLLPAAGFIKLHHYIRIGCLEIGWRIIECQMAILTYPNKRHIDLTRGDELTQAFAFGTRLHRRAIDEVECPRMKTFNEALLQIPSEARRVIFRQSYVFVEVKEGCPAPVDVSSPKLFEKFRL